METKKPSYELTIDFVDDRKLPAERYLSVYFDDNQDAFKNLNPYVERALRKLYDTKYNGARVIIKETQSPIIVYRRTYIVVKSDKPSDENSGKQEAVCDVCSS